MLDEIIKSAVPIVENRIKDIIRGLGREFNIPATEILIILKMTDGINRRMEIFAFSKGEKLKRIELNPIKGNITKVVENYIAAVFKFDAKRFEVDTGRVNYKFYLMMNGELMGRRNIAGHDFDLLNLEDLLFKKY